MKGIGPFEWQGLSSKGRFAVFWSGEKIQACGFPWELLRNNRSFPLLAGGLAAWRQALYNQEHWTVM